MRERDLTFGSPTVKVTFGVEPIYNEITILDDLASCEFCTGMGEWLYHTAKALPASVMRQHRLVFSIFHLLFYDIVSPENGSSFPAFIDAFAALDPVEGRDAAIEQLRRHFELWSDPDVQSEPPPPAEQLISNAETYVRWFNSVHYDDYGDDLLYEAHALLNDPVHLHEMTVQHLRMMWAEVLAAEWERVLPTLQASVAAFQKHDYSQLTLFEAIRAVTGRDVRPHWGRGLNSIEHVIFAPTAHSGPYLTKAISGRTLRLMFTARLPKGIQTGSATLTRAQLLIWLNALADDSRLRILELLTHEDQLRAQDIINQTGLSQSVISRHLSQLSATGYLTERREDGIKYYSLNLERLEETTEALLHFLRKK